MTKGARRERHEKRETLFYLLGLPQSFLASRSKLARVHPPPPSPLNLKKKRDSLLSSRAAAVVSSVSLEARARAFSSINLKKKRDCSHSNPPAMFTAQGW